MKLSRIPGAEPTLKQSLNLKKSTVDLLQKYQEACELKARVPVGFKDLVEQMLLDFMAEDKDFQRYLKDPPEHVIDSKKVAAQKRAAEPAVTPVSGSAAASPATYTGSDNNDL